MKKVFLDSGGIISLVLSSEPSHDLAVKVFKKFSAREMVTTDHILGELVTWFRKKTNFDSKAIFKILHNLYVAGLEVVEVDRDIFGLAMILMDKYQDHTFSFADCSSFVVMKKLGIKDVFTTDSDFAKAGFNNLLAVG